MGLFSWLALAGSIVCLLLAIMVSLFNRKDRLNRVFIYAILFGCYTAFTSYMTLISDSAQTAFLWNKAGFLWPVFIVLLYQFVLVFTEDWVATKKRRFILLYAPAAFFAVADLVTNQISGYPVQEYWGYIVPSASTLLATVFSIWSTSVSIASIFLCVRYYFRVSEEHKKQQAKFITIGLTFPLLMIVLVGGAYALFGWVIPHSNAGANAMLCIFIFYAIWKHDLFNLNPSTAAENIIATMSDSFILTDLKGKILRVNSAFTDLLGYQESEMKGETIFQLIPDANAAQILAGLQKNGQIWNYETQVRTKQLINRSAAVSATVIKDKRGKDAGFALVFHDLTRRKQYEQQILKNERFAAIGELAGMIGHDLRNPLTSIQGATYYLKRKYAGGMDASGQEMLETIEQSVTYSNKIINDLLDYSRDIKLDLEKTDTKALLTEAVAISQPINVQVVDLTSQAHELVVDKAKLTRVFVNLIKNAADAMPNGGTLTVTSTENKDGVDISFQDTGIGMTHEIIGKLWTPLFTTKARGMGFGLPICKRIVDAHGGRIGVESVVGKGSTFTISIPVEGRQIQKTSSAEAVSFQAAAEPLVEKVD